MTKKIILFIILLYFSAGITQDYKWYVKMENGDIYPNVALGHLVGDSLIFHAKSIGEITLDQDIQIPLVSLVELGKKENQKRFF